MSFLSVPVLAFLELVKDILSIYQFFVIVYVILGWLEAFNVVDRYNQFVYNLHTFLFRITEPALMPLRRILPAIGGFDLSPLALLLLLGFFIRMISMTIH